MKFTEPCPHCGNNDSIWKREDGYEKRKCNLCKKEWIVGGEALKNIPPEQQHESILNEQIYKNKISELRRENKLLKDKGIANRDLLHQFQAGIQKFPLVEKIPRVKIDKSKSPESMTAMLSDFHINQTVSWAETEGYAEYNFDIFCNRYWYLIHKIIRVKEIHDRESNIRILYVDFLGDIYNGLFRPEQIATNEFPFVMANILGSHVIAQGLAMLSPHFDKIIITGVTGNEARLTPKKESRHKFNSQDFLSYQMISALLEKYIKNGRMEFNIPLSPECIIVKDGWKFLLTHGDNVKSWAGIPYYGIERKDARNQKMRRRDGGYDYWEMGHFHTPTELEGNKFVNGSVVGTGEFARNDLTLFNDPIQKVFGLHKDRGVTWSRNINLSEASENGFTYSTDMVLGDA